ncbi:MAG: prenyltransferase/squalene oxidase repeat-containing protein [Chthoniobacterales bacterium]
MSAEKTSRDAAIAGLQSGLSFLLTQQRDRGCWQGEVKWNTMLVSQYVIAHHICGQIIAPERKEQLLRYLRFHVLPDGGWGMHSESPAYVFHTALAYIAARLLGVPAADPLARRAREWLEAHGGVLAIPTWGKFWLALIGIYGWEGVNPILPELWLLPRAFPLHPTRLYNHTRLIALPMAYLYGARFTAPISEITLALRGELYSSPFGKIDFSKHRDHVAASDLFVQKNALLRAFDATARFYERFDLEEIRQSALDACYARILAEVRTSGGVSLSPVNGSLNLIALWDRRAPEFAAAQANLDYWSWSDAREGLRFCGAHSHTWDTSFTIRAIEEIPQGLAGSAAQVSLTRAYGFLRDSQILEDLPAEERERNRGGWCFSDERHQWPVSDCTAEALIALLKFEPQMAPAERISDQSLVAAVEFILSRQNRDGGFGSFERRRGPRWLESLNPTEMFGNCVVEGSYLECTASCLSGLAHFRQRFPEALRPRIERAMARAVRSILKRQCADGSWEGSWGVNFTYAIFLCAEGLVAGGLSHAHPALRRAGEWLLGRQKADGGWGEHWSSCLRGEYCEHPNSQVIMTAWAVLSLLKMGTSRAAGAVERAVSWLLSRQQLDGDFPSESPAGVFFRTGLLHYELYKNYFPLWALARYLGDEAMSLRRTKSS